VTPRIKRRDFLLLRARSDGSATELSCQHLLMKYLDAQMEGKAADLFARLERELTGVREVRLVDTEWLAQQDFKKELQRVLNGFSKRGGRIAAQQR
jgi:hypothetical protein